jgi:hypothetical protein
MVLNLYAPNVGAPNLIKHTLLNLQTQIDPQQSSGGKFQTSYVTNMQQKSTNKLYKCVSNS